MLEGRQFGRLPAFKMFTKGRDVSDAIANYSTAKGYVQSAFLIATNPARLIINDDRSFVLSYHMLLGFAVELYLKAFLQERCHAHGKLRSAAVRHNLEDLLQMAVADGFDPSKAESLVAYLDVQHGNFEFRYVNRESQYMLRWHRDVFAELDRLDNYVDDVVGASQSMGLQPGEGGWLIANEYNGWRLPRSASVTAELGRTLPEEQA